jgi:hypothetical protein
VRRTDRHSPWYLACVAALVLVCAGRVADAKRKDGAVDQGPHPADACGRIVAVADLHGGYDAFVEVLGRAGLVDQDLRWIAEDACLVQLGDIPDRGARSREVLELMMDLQRQAPERVFPMLGNHEVMNIVGDLRYVTPGEFASYADEERPEDRQRGLEAFAIAVEKDCSDEPPPSDDEIRARFDEAFPPGWFGHRRAFGPDGEIGRWLRGLPVVVQIGGSVFVHGGLSVADASLGVAKINRRATEELADFVRLRQELIDQQVIGPLAGYKDSFLDVETAMNKSDAKLGPRMPRKTKKLAQQFLALRTASIFRGDGPLWNRDLAKMDEAAYGDSVTQILKELNAERIAVGHTPQGDGRIRARFDGRVFLIDTGAGPHYGGHVSALEIVGDEVRALYPGKEAERVVEAR